MGIILRVALTSLGTRKGGGGGGGGYSTIQGNKPCFYFFLLQLCEEDKQWVGKGVSVIRERVDFLFAFTILGLFF